MNSNSKEIAKLKKKYSKWPPKRNFFKNRSQILTYLPASISVWILKHLLIKSAYKLKRESIKFFQLSAGAYGAGKRYKAQRLLTVALRLLGDFLPEAYISLLRSAVSSTSRDQTMRVSISSSVLDATLAISVLNSDATDWYQLSRGLFSVGFFRAAWVARENSVNLSILESTAHDTSSTVLIRGIQAHLERNNIFRVRKIVLENNQRLSEERMSQIEHTASLLESSYGASCGMRSSGLESNIELFRSLISDKSVAIVGAGPPRGDYGDEIDEFETVIRIKFIGGRMLDSRQFHGSRTDISFIGAIDAVKVQELELRDEFKSFKLLLTNPTAIKSIGSIPIYALEENALIYRTTTTSGIRSLMEVLKFSPSKLKIFGFDFYSTLTARSKEVTAFYENFSWQFGHANDFIKDGHDIKFMRALDFSYHDPVSNFCFAQNLYKAGLFDIEPYGKSILELTPYQYVERLEEMLGDW